MDEVKLLREIQNGDRDAFRQLFGKYQHKVYNTIFSLVRNQEDALDLSQEVFVEVFKSASKFRGESSIATWIYRIAVNKSLNHLKKARLKTLSIFRETQKSDAEAEFALDVADASSNPEKQMQDRELGKTLQQALDTLPERQRLAFVLQKLEGLSHKDIAVILNTSVSSVESLLHRAKLSLQTKLLKSWREETE